MSVNIAINGFGRIGRLILRAIVEKNFLGKEINLVAINDLISADHLAYLLKYDSTQGTFKGLIEVEKGNKIKVNNYSIQCLNIPEGPEFMPWNKLNIDIVIESTGLFTDLYMMQKHINSGAKKVLLSAAPAKGNLMKTIVIGVNCNSLKKDDYIVSNSSCTTNCLAILIKVLIENFGINEGLMSTIHSYTSNQKVIDSISCKDWRSGRSAGSNIIPTSTNAADALSLIIPEVAGKITGTSFRVPTAAVSLVDLTVSTIKKTSYKEICQKIYNYSLNELNGILSYTQDQVVSSDLIHNSSSAIFDVNAGLELNSNFFKLICWYDNEWGYSNRCVDLINKMS